MTYTIEDVKRLAPEAGEVHQGPDYIEVVVNGFMFTVRHPLVKALLDTRRKLEIAREALEKIAHLGDANPDCNHSGEYLDAKTVALATIKELS